jgi:hypothetical protein
MELFLRIFKHLLPRGRAFKITIEKPLRSFFVGLARFADTMRANFDDIYGDMFPQYTRKLDLWEDQFALPPSVTVEQKRRDRLDAAWKATGGQSPWYIQNVLRGAGFDVYVHESFDAANSNTVRNPNAVLRGGSVTAFFEARSGIIRSGSVEARSGNFQGLIGFALTNVTGNPGDLFPAIPTDPDTWPFFMYVGGQTFPNPATVPPARKDEFIALCLKICPTHLWIGAIVEFA